MATPTLDPKTSDTVQALVQLLRSRSSEEIRQRMYDNPPGSPWWAACKTELDLRNSERAATALVDTSRILDKIRSATDYLDELTDKLLQATTDMSEVVKSVRESGRRPVLLHVGRDLFGRLLHLAGLDQRTQQTGLRHDCDVGG